MGFRFSAISLAALSGVSGWVKNLSDGRVELLAEAEEEVLKDFLGKIQDSFSRYIEDTDIRWQEAMGEFKDFSLRY